MRMITLTKHISGFFTGLLFLTGGVYGQSAGPGIKKNELPTARAASYTRQEAPNRVAPAVLQQEKKQKPEIDFDATSGIVTIKMQLQDLNGSLIPYVRRDNFAVYENGVRQPNATVEIEHAPVSLAVLLEWGGRYQALNKALAQQVPQAAHQLVDELGPKDRIAIFRYGDRVDQVADFSSGRETLDGLFIGLNKPEFSELNFYDALIATLDSMKKVNGRKAVILISSGVDTFSKASYEQALAAARDSGTPIYVINIGPGLRESVERTSNAGPYARLDWNRAAKELQEIAKACGGRVYVPDSIFHLSGVYDDLMENLRVRYVITYKPAVDTNTAAERVARVELINPQTGEPLEVVDANGKSVRSKVFVEGRYVARTASVADVSKSIPKKLQEHAGGPTAH